MEILNEILLSKGNRRELIKQFQQSVWNNNIDSKTMEEKYLREIAYDLDFYEPDDGLRKQDANYYNDIELEERIKAVLQKLSGLK